MSREHQPAPSAPSAAARFTLVHLALALLSAMTLLAGSAVAATRLKDARTIAPKAAPPAPAPSPSASEATETPAPRSPGAASVAFVEVEGVVYDKVEEDVRDELIAEMRAGSDGLSDALVDDTDVRYLLADDEEFGMMISLAMSPSVAGSKTFEQGFIAGMASEADEKPRIERIGGMAVSTFRPEEDVEAFAVKIDRFLLLVIVDAGSPARAFLGSLIPKLRAGDRAPKIVDPAAA